MTELFRRASAGAVALLLGSTAICSAGEMSAKSAPRPVMQTVTARFKDAKVVGVAREKTEDQKEVYEVSLVDQGRHIDVILNPDGSMVLFEREIAFKELPQPVAATLGEQYAKARYKLVEEVYKMVEGKEALAYYEMLLTDSKKQVAAVEIAADGKILKVEKKKSLNED